MRSSKYYFGRMKKDLRLTEHFLLILMKRMVLMIRKIGSSPQQALRWLVRV